MKVSREEVVTERLRLTSIRLEDRTDLIALMTDEEVGQTYMVPDLTSEEKKNALFERFCTLSGSDQRFVRAIRLDHRLIGVIHEVEKREDEIELGYVVSPAEKNRGYASEAVRGAVSALFSMGYSVVRAGAFSENAASLRVMEKSGMVRTGQTETIEYRGKSHLCIYCEIHKS